MMRGVRGIIGGLIIKLHDKVCPCQQEWVEIDAWLYTENDGEVSKTRLRKMIREEHRHRP